MSNSWAFFLWVRSATWKYGIFKNFMVICMWTFNVTIQYFLCRGNIEMNNLFCIAWKQCSSPVWVTHIRTYRCISQMDQLSNLKWMQQQKCHKLLVLKCNSFKAMPTSFAFLGFWIPSCFGWFATTSVNTFFLWSSFPSWKVKLIALKNTFNTFYFSNYLSCIFVRKYSIPFVVSHSRICQRKFHLDEAFYLKFWNV